jgi:hypothetical protein
MELDEPLRGVVTLLAQALKRTEPEFLNVAMVRLDLIADCRRRDDGALQAIPAERMTAEWQRAGEYHLSHFVG